jgi:hypothetical protein
MIMIWAIVVGMACLNEIRFYQTEQLGGIVFATGVCVAGISFLLQKTKEKAQ